jgi:hypothetical protein
MPLTATITQQKHLRTSPTPQVNYPGYSKFVKIEVYETILQMLTKMKAFK